jgi:nanoRNase/pAp phosphatase (c-di-AMP/oligoRNAs hydrolase)
MITSDQVTQLKELLSTARSLVVVLSPSPTFDQVASATALMLTLQAQGKEVMLVGPDRSKISPEELAGIDQLKTELGHQNLHVSFDYNPTSVDKVSYHIDEEQQKFFLVIKPQKGHKPLDTSSVNFTYAGAEADLVFLVGVHQLESLEQLYVGYEELYQNATLVTLHTFEPDLGHIKLNSSGFSSLSEATGTLLLHLATEITAEVATNILAGIEASTENFKSLTTTADTFELVARLMRSGARRLKRKVAPVQAQSLAAVLNNRKIEKPLSVGSGGAKPPTKGGEDGVTTLKAEGKVEKTKPKPTKPQDGPRTFYP